MNERIALVIKAKNITSSQLADEMGVQRSGVSHIMNNRNKPSLEFIQKLLKRYPEISTEWLLFGEGPMMKPFTAREAQNEPSPEPVPKTTPPKPFIMELFVDEDTAEDKEAGEMEESSPVKWGNQSENQQVEPQNPPLETMPEKPSEKTETIPEAEIAPVAVPEERKFINPDIEPEKLPDTKKPVIQKNNRRLEKIVMFYSDKSFSEYYPESDAE
jgi:transcriptional regulator with XRE-family HTH domain